MILFPAIDLKQGQCVRLIHGDMAQATVFNDSPGDQAAQFERIGFEYLHVVDLDGAFAGKSMNGEAVDTILASISMPVQLGGGIRSMENVERWLSKGIARVIIGTAAAKNPELVRQAAKAFPGKIAIGIDSRDGFVAVEGWAEKSEITAIELGKRLEDAGVAALIYTDISRDGVLTGLNIEATLELANTIAIPVIASGGLASIEDIKRLLEPDCALLEGAISGRAIYDGRLDPIESLKVIREAKAQHHA
ncbi:MAG: 1-(5-phosphoribosyl)-5-[(5-phosphoribosylamino)methylideneamino]imidazole-4-carboxamide isomerase [Hyphomicrobiales bacterium]|nr:1-(5-phosphoribosyl)-5-[(5-phosphoribosylamino)methylideneamino]imidazole-4-carboxamide isomerase [Hyphomicrobiales bacterium]